MVLQKYYVYSPNFRSWFSPAVRGVTVADQPEPPASAPIRIATVVSHQTPLASPTVPSAKPTSALPARSPTFPPACTFAAGSSPEQRVTGQSTDRSSRSGRRTVAMWSFTPPSATSRGPLSGWPTGRLSGHTSAGSTANKPSLTARCGLWKATSTDSPLFATHRVWKRTGRGAF